MINFVVGEDERSRGQGGERKAELGDIGDVVVLKADGWLVEDVSSNGGITTFE